MDLRPALAYGGIPMSDKRIRDYNITIGELPCGPRNAITDVPGVTVGHCTIDTPEHQTGVTVVIPAPHNLFAHKLPAASYVLNGFGKTLGLVPILVVYPFLQKYFEKGVMIGSVKG